MYLFYISLQQVPGIPQNLFWYDAVQIFALVLLLLGMRTGFNKITDLTGRVIKLETMFELLDGNDLKHIRKRLHALDGKGEERNSGD